MIYLVLNLVLGDLDFTGNQISHWLLFFFLGFFFFFHSGVVV